MENKQYNLIISDPMFLNKMGMEIKKKSRMCNKIVESGDVNCCPYKDQCNFAHSISEISILQCSYGEKCIFVICHDSKTLNLNTDKICYFRHPEESDNNFHKRVGNVATDQSYTYQDDYVFDTLENIEPVELDITKPSKDDRWETVYSNPPSEQKNTLFLKKEHVLSTVQQLIDIGERQINIQIIV